MTLTTHAIVGAAAAQIFPSHPVLGFFAGFASHFLIDSIPHWDYKILSFKEGEAGHLNDDMILNSKFLIDLLRIGADFWIGIILSLLIYTKLTNSNPLIIILGSLGGIFPDPLQFLYWKTKFKLLEPLQRFHIWIQDGMHFRHRPLIGIPLQILLDVAIIAFVKKFV